MFDRLFEILQAIWHALLPFVVIQPYERGALVRLGKFKREVEPGFHWRWPLKIDEVFYENVMPRTEHIPGLSTTTADGKSIGFDAIVTYEIADIQKALLGVNDLKDAIADSCAGEIGTNLADHVWADIVHGKVLDKLTSVCRRRGKQWGVEIIRVQLAGVALVKNLRISSSSSHSPSLLHHN